MQHGAMDVMAARIHRWQHTQMPIMCQKYILFQRWLPKQGRNTYTVRAEATGDLKGADELWDKRSTAQQTKRNRPMSPWGQYSRSVCSSD